MSNPISQQASNEDAVLPAENHSALVHGWRVSVVVSLLCYFVLQIFWINATPIKLISAPGAFPDPNISNILAGTGPDELPHYLYIIALYKSGRLPVPAERFRHYQPFALDQLMVKDGKLVPVPTNYETDQFVTSEAQHPPLYYLIAATVLKIVHKAGDRNVWLILRWTNAIFGAVTIILISRIALTAFKNRPLIVLATAPFVALLPIFNYVNSTVSNIPSELLLTALALLLTCQVVFGERKFDIVSMAQVGFVMGLASITRMTGLVWLPALAVILIGCIGRMTPSERPDAIRSMVVGGLICAVFAGSWLQYCHHAFGSAVFRSDYRPMLGHISLWHYLTHPHEKITTFNTDAKMGEPPLTLTLWIASGAWVPFWLMQFSLPGGLYTQGLYQAAFLVIDIFAAYLLVRHTVMRSRSNSDDDPRYRILLWAFGIVTTLSVLLVLQQQLWVDELMIIYAGRYIVSAVAGSAFLALFALSTLFPAKQNTAIIGAILIGVLGVAFNVICLHLVTDFYSIMNS